MPLRDSSSRHESKWLRIRLPFRDSSSRDRRKWRLAPNREDMERRAKDPAVDEAALLWSIVNDLSKARKTNYQTIKGRTVWLNLAAALLVLQILVWSLVLLK